MRSGKKVIISAIIITNPNWFGAEEKLADCLKTVAWIDERLLVVSEVTVELKKIARNYCAKLIKQQGRTFADWRNFAARQANGKWLLYVDADERVTKGLKREIHDIVSSKDTKAAYAIPRSNILLRKEMRYGGWWPDYVLRLMQRTKLIRYEGDLHEQPIIKGEIGYLKSPLLHLKHEKLEEMVEKTINWSETEAELMRKANHPPMNMRRFVRPMVTEMFRRLVFKAGLLDGTEGVIDGIYQGFSRFISYACLWEKQIGSLTHENIKA